MATYENTRSFHSLEIINPAGEVAVCFMCVLVCVCVLGAHNKAHNKASEALASQNIGVP